MITPSSPGSAIATIHLVRHARSAYVHHGRWMDRAGVSQFERDYNAAGIHDDSLPPADLVATASNADVIAASDMLRAVLSARRLAPAREPDVSPLLREIELEPPRWIPIRLPLDTWDWFTYVQWSYRLLTNADDESARRAESAVDWLLQRATGSAQVIAITHGGFRRILDARLVARDWKRVPGPRSFANWSTWSYTG